MTGTSFCRTKTLSQFRQLICGCTVKSCVWQKRLPPQSHWWQDRMPLSKHLLTSCFFSLGMKFLFIFWTWRGWIAEFLSFFNFKPRFSLRKTARSGAIREENFVPHCMYHFTQPAQWFSHAISGIAQHALFLAASMIPQQLALRVGHPKLWTHRQQAGLQAVGPYRCPLLFHGALQKAAQPVGTWRNIQRHFGPGSIGRGWREQRDELVLAVGQVPKSPLSELQPGNQGLSPKGNNGTATGKCLVFRSRLTEVFVLAATASTKPKPSGCWSSLSWHTCWPSLNLNLPIRMKRKNPHAILSNSVLLLSSTRPSKCTIWVTVNGGLCISFRFLAYKVLTRPRMRPDPMMDVVPVRPKWKLAKLRANKKDLAYVAAFDSHDLT